MTSAGAIAGCTAQTLLVSRTAAALANYDASQQFPAVSDNGIVVFNTSADNLIADPVPGASASGVLLDSQLPSISADGRFIGFPAQGENSSVGLLATPPLNLQLPGGQAMLFDSCVIAAGNVARCTPHFAYASVLDSGNLDITLAAQANLQPSLSDDGRFIWFALPYNLAPAYQGGTAVYVRDACGGASAPPSCVPHTALVSVDASGVQAGSVG